MIKKPLSAALGLLIGVSMLLSACAGTDTPTTAPTTGATTTVVSSGNTTPTGAATMPPTAAVATTAPAVATATLAPIGSPQPTAFTIPKTAGTVVIGVVAQDIDTLFPMQTNSVVGSLYANCVFNSLIGVNDQNVPYPDLATQIPTIENGGAKYIGEGADKALQVTFKIRPDATWSDGKPVTANDALFSYKMLMNPASGAAANNVELKFSKVEAPDPQTLVITYMSEKETKVAAAKPDSADAPNPMKSFADQVGPLLDPLYLYGLADTAIYPEHLISPLLDNKPMESPKLDPKTFGETSYAQNPIGSGPYTFVSRNAGQTITLKARTDYWRTKPQIANVVFAVLGDKNALLEQMKNGNVDVASSVGGFGVIDAPTLDPLNQQGKIKPFYVPGTAWEHLDFNVQDPILSDKNIRQAIAYGVDRQTLVEKAMGGRAKVIDSFILPYHPLFDPTVPKYPYDVAKANKMLDDAGWKINSSTGIREKNGQPLKIKWQSTGNPIRKVNGPLLKDQMKQIGIDLDVQYVAKGFFSSTGPLQTHTFQIGEFAWVGAIDPGNDALSTYGSYYIPTKENSFSGNNFIGYKNAEVDKLLFQGTDSFDLATRKGIYAKVQQQIMGDMITLPLFQEPNVTAISPKLKGYKPPIGSTGETWNIEEWSFSS